MSIRTLLDFSFAALILSDRDRPSGSVDQNGFDGAVDLPEGATGRTAPKRSRQSRPVDKYLLALAKQNCEVTGTISPSTDKTCASNIADTVCDKFWSQEKMEDSFKNLKSERGKATHRQRAAAITAENVRKIMAKKFFDIEGRQPKPRETHQMIKELTLEHSEHPATLVRIV